MVRFPIRLKLAAALIVPMLTLVGVAVYEVVQTRNAAAELNEQVDLATAIAGPSSLLTTVQDERNVLGVELLGLDPIDVGMQNAGATEEAIQNTDARIQEFRDFLSDQSPEIQAVYDEAMAGLENLDEIRQQGLNELQQLEQSVPEGEERDLDPAAAPQAYETFVGYDDYIQPLLDANSQVAISIRQPNLRRGANLIDLGQRQEDMQARLLAQLIGATFAPDQYGLDDTNSRSLTAGQLAELRANQVAMQANADGPYTALVDSYLQTEHIVAFPTIVDEALAGDTIRIADAFETVNVSDDALGEGELSTANLKDEVTAELESKSGSLQSDASLRLWIYLGLAVFGLLLAAVIVMLVSRTITRPLRSLTRQAGGMAHERLPETVQDILETPLGQDVSVPEIEPIRVQTRDEVADVAQALNTVQDSAVDLAVEQAVLRRNIADSFVNLGRRNQNLLGRQLDFITELEQHETDPDTLANLFRLDHLATRMRRNAESLLVLAGIEPPRQWAAPVRLTDVIRAALGEVEDYQRVTVRAVEATTIIGAAAADLAHLLAELIENALTFSPPDQTVEIRGRVQAHQTGYNGSPVAYGYALSIIDSGLGMGPEEITRANRRLAGAESFTIAPSKYLGHYVAGNLAARHNITIELQTSSTAGTGSNGITAMAYLPPPLLTTDGTDGGDEIDYAPGAPELREALPNSEFPAALGPAPGAPSPPPPAPTPFPAPAMPAVGPEAPQPDAPFPAPQPATASAPTSWQIPGGQPAAVTAEQPALGQALNQQSDAAQSSGRTHTNAGLAKRQPGRTQSRIPTAGPERAPTGRQADTGEVAPQPVAAPQPAPAPAPAGAPGPQVSEELLKTLATYTDKLHRNVNPARPATPPRGSSIDQFPSSPPTPLPESPMSPLPGPGDAQTAAGPTMHTAAASQHTSSGLTRRVRGAQLPTTEPLGLRRGQTDSSSPQNPAMQSDVRAPGRVSSSGLQPPAAGSFPANQGTPADGRAGGTSNARNTDTSDEMTSGPARDVYNFLSSFTSGVERGLNEAHNMPRPTNEEDL